MIKKSLLGVLVFGLLLITNYTHASTPDAMPDTTPRIMYWWGKVNQHIDSSGNWQTDPDGTSGANLDKLTYCKKWYPNTTSVIPYQSETISTWRRAMGYEQSGYTATMMSDKCVTDMPQDLSLKVLSPNGGEIFQTGQSMTIKWASTGYNSASVVSLDLSTQDSTGSAANTFLMSASGLANDGTETLTIPSNVPTASNYAMHITIYDPVSTRWQSDNSDATFTIQTAIAPPVAHDPTPRIAYWYGKVNQHVDSQGNWLTDPDGVSGANLDKLTYCKKWYPNTASVRDYRNETITGWRERGNVGGPYTLEVMTMECVPGRANSITPLVSIVAASGTQSSRTGISINIGNQFTISGTPQGLQGLSYWTGNGYPPSGYYNMAYFFDQAFGNNNSCGNNESTAMGPWIMSCTASVSGSSQFYINIYTNGQVYQSNIVTVTIGSSELSSSSCRDSDGGMDVNVFGLTDGRINGIGTYFSDQSVGLRGEECLSTGNCTGVAEGYCKDGNVTNLVIQCPSGKSKDGVCVRQTMTVDTKNNVAAGATDKSIFKRTLKVGVRGDDVKALQVILGIKADGVYGRGTAEKVKEWQKTKGLKADGSFGVQSQAILK